MRTKILWALCALLLGIGCTAAFFLVGPGGRGADAPGIANTPGATAEAPAPEASEPEKDNAGSGGMDAAPQKALASWDESSDAYRKLTEFVDAACDPDDSGYIPPEDRVATFDMDGTFLCEKAPIYFNQAFTCWHILDDPTYDAPDDLKGAVESVIDQVHSGIVPQGVNLNDVCAESYRGATPDELMADVLRFADTPAEGFSGMTYAESFYRPMIEVIGYLRANDFDVYVVTACERYVSRALAGEYAGFDGAHVIGTDLPLAATEQGEKSGDIYTLQQDEDLVIAGTAPDLTGKTNKAIAIEEEIGRRPVLAFGNSSGDFAMLNYAVSNPEHPGLGFLVVADDEQREYGDAEKGDEMSGQAEKQGWVGISMRDDWTTIYGEGVKKTSLPAAA